MTCKIMSLRVVLDLCTEVRRYNYGRYVPMLDVIKGARSVPNVQLYMQGTYMPCQGRQSFTYGQCGRLKRLSRLADSQVSWAHS